MVSRAIVVILRVHLGVILLLTVIGKLTRDQPFSVEMLAFLQRATRNSIAPYRAFTEHVVIPHAHLFSVLVMIGELVAGLSLLFGVATRVGAVIAMMLFLNYMLAKGRMFWSPDSEDAAVFFSALVVCLAAAGRTLGVDALLHRRWPRVPAW